MEVEKSSETPEARLWTLLLCEFSLSRKLSSLQQFERENWRGFPFKFCVNGIRLYLLGSFIRKNVLNLNDLFISKVIYMKSWVLLFFFGPFLICPDITHKTGITI
jgi:hypothetical protein